MSLCASDSSYAQPQAPLLEIDGASRLSAEEVKRLAGEVPSDLAERRDWAARLPQRITAAYQRMGYTFARAWSRVNAQGRVELAIDEGRMQIAFIGASTLRSVLYRVNLHLPGNVFHRPTLRRTLDDLRRQYNLIGVYYRVTEEHPLLQNRFGLAVAQRLLRIYTLTRERFGWRLAASLNSIWGVVPKGALRYRDVFGRDDRIESSLAIAVPFRRFVFEEDPRFQWVHGRLRLGYRFPPLFFRAVAPMVEADSQLSRYSRSDQAIESYLGFEGSALLKAVLLLTRAFTFEVGPGVHYTRVFDVSPADALADPDLLRFITRFQPSLSFDRELKRRDQRSYLRLRLDVGLSSEGTTNDDRLFIDTELQGQAVWQLGQSDLIVRARGTVLAGDVRFWDETPLAGSYLRTFFDNRYWVRKALQATLAFRLALTDTIKIGAFHDAAIFSDRTQVGHPSAVANSFGPSAHFLLFDLFAFDVYYGFGFDRLGFDHNISFTLRSAF